MANINDLHNRVLGVSGSKIVTATNEAVTSETYYAVQFVTECTPTVFTVNNGTGTYSGIKYPAGFVFYGDIRSITPAAGETVILYKH
jgi:hypothetical protein